LVSWKSKKQQTVSHSLHWKSIKHYLVQLECFNGFSSFWEVKQILLCYLYLIFSIIIIFLLV